MDARGDAEEDDRDQRRRRPAGVTGERVAREPWTGRAMKVALNRVRSGPVGERAAPTPGQDPLAPTIART